MSTLILTGATGFIGRHLLNALLADGHSVRALTRRAPPPDAISNDKLTWIIGDVEDMKVWRNLLVPGSIVINLAYSNASPQSSAVNAAKGIAEACVESKIARFIHCSTASVYGENRDFILTERSPCSPRTTYGRLKLAVEGRFKEVHGRFPVVILRPSSVFGEGGNALFKHLNDLTNRSMFANYCRASLFGRRNMHLLPVETVVAAIKYLTTLALPTEFEIFNLSADDDPLNNFYQIEEMARRNLGLKRYPIRPLPIPRSILEFLLYYRHSTLFNTRVIYDMSKLLEQGFVAPISLEAALDIALRRFKETHQAEL